MTLVAGCAALHVAPTLRVAKAATARRATALVMDEEADIALPFNTDVTAAAAAINEVMENDGISDAEAVAKAAWLAKTYGDDPWPVRPAAAAPPAAAGEQLSPELVALTDEKKTLDAALELGYDAEKVKRLAEVEALLAEAAGPAPETALSPEEAAKAAWLARTRR